MTKYTLSPISRRLFELACHFESYADEHTETLTFEDYETLRDFEIKLLAYANLWESRDQDRFLDEELKEAEQYLAGLPHSTSE